MGTRADFYIGRGDDAEWLGSIAWDGYPESMPLQLLNAESEHAFRHALECFFKSRDDVSLPSDGWPWPWETSHTTDYAYAFDEGAVWASCFGRPWFDARKEQPEDDDGETPVFPDMTENQNVQFGGSKSGLIVISS